VKNLDALDHHDWSGHAVIVGRRRRSWQERDEVLAHLRKKREAVSLYRQFVADALAMGRREELTGGGLRRSGWRLGDIERAAACKGILAWR
jgi:putative transposase